MFFSHFIPHTYLHNTGKIGRGGKNTRAAANAAKSKLTPVAPVTPAVPTEIVFESGGMTPACTRVQNLFEDIIDKFPHTVPPLSSKQVLTSKPPDSVSSCWFRWIFFDVYRSFLCLCLITLAFEHRFVSWNEVFFTHNQFYTATISHRVRREV